MSRLSHDICEMLHIKSSGYRHEEGQPGQQKAKKGIPPILPTKPTLADQINIASPAHPPALQVPHFSPVADARRMVLAGGSGFLGGLLTRHFAERGWDIIILTRGMIGQASCLSEPPKTARTQSSNGREDLPTGRHGPIGTQQQTGNVSFLRWDGRTPGEWTTALEGAQVVINLAGRSVNCRYHARNRRLMLDSRVEATRVIGEAIGHCRRPPQVWLNLSTATIYKHTFGQPWDERGNIGATPEAKDAFSIEVATAWERAFDEAITSVTRKIALRSAMVFGLSGDANNVHRVLRRLTRFGLGGRMGSGRQFVSWIHERDFCRAVEFIIEHGSLAGPVNLAAPNPLTNSQMMRIYRRRLSRPIGLPAPEWLLELGAFFLRTETELIIKSRRVVPGRLREAGFKFEFQHLNDALDDLERRLRPA